MIPNRKHLLLSLLLSNGPLAFAQCDSLSLGFDPLTQHMETRAFDVDSGEMLTVSKPYRSPIWANWSLDQLVWNNRSMTVAKHILTGDSVWTERIIPTNPKIQLEPVGIKRTHDGGALVYGDAVHRSVVGLEVEFRYKNQFAVKMSDSGTVEWARMYMLPDQDVLPVPPYGPFFYKNFAVAHNGAAELSGGGYRLAVRNAEEVFTMDIDEAGLPVAARSYKDDALGLQWGAAALQEDGTLLDVRTVSEDVIETTFFSAGPDGTLDWAWRLPQAPLITNHYMQRFWVTRTASNGDRLLIMQDEGPTTARLVRFSPTGSVVWAKTVYIGGAVDLQELANGDIILLTNVKLFRMAGDGSGDATVWQDSSSEVLSNFEDLDAQGDSVAILSPFAMSKIDLTTSVAELTDGCSFVELNPEWISDATMTPVPANILVEPVVAKSWAMSLGDPQGLDLDLSAAGAFSEVRPGFSSWIVGGVVNWSGTDCGAATVTCTLPGIMTTMLIQPDPASVVDSTVTWVLDNGLAADSIWYFSILTSLPPDPELIGTFVHGVVNVAQASAEVDTVNNTFLFSRIITGAYDPNNKVAHTSSGNNDSLYYTGVDQWIDYTINFQNTGTAPAETVMIEDTLPATLRVGSFMLLGASHPFQHDLGGNGIVRFTFADIQLPDSNSNEPESHGMVHFRIKPEPGLPPGTLIANRADIFFDFNPPIRTEDSRVWIDQVTGIGIPPVPRLSVFPVPVEERLLVVAPKDFAPSGLSISSMDGRCLLRSGVSPAKGTISVDVASLPPQVYVLSLEGKDGRRLSTRFVKE